MQVSGSENIPENMTWNRYVDWQDRWKDGGHQGDRGWFEHPSDVDCSPQYDAYGSWQPPTHGGTNSYADCGNTVQLPGVGLNGHVQMYASEHDTQDASSFPHWGRDAEGHHHMGNHANNNGSNGGNLRTSNAPAVGQGQRVFYGFNAGPLENDQPPHRPQRQQPQHRQPLGSSLPRAPQHLFAAPSNAVAANTVSEADDARMAELEESMGRMLPLQNDNSDDEDDLRSKVPAEATEQEREEAERIVRTAFKEAKERDKLREKVKKCGQADLQALLNARLAKGK